MSKYIDDKYLFKLPSGQNVHPCRLIIKDGTLMWKDALCTNNSKGHIPKTEAHEQHIIKTAQRLEELNTWVSTTLEPWEAFKPLSWYNYDLSELCQGISLYFNHKQFSNQYVIEKLISHIYPHEELELRGNYIFFKRC